MSIVRYLESGDTDSAATNRLLTYTCGDVKAMKAIGSGWVDLGWKDYR